MLKTIEAMIDVDGVVHLKEPVPVAGPCRALVTILDEGADTQVDEATALSEAALAEDWDRPEEDQAWSHLQPRR